MAEKMNYPQQDTGNLPREIKFQKPIEYCCWITYNE